MGKETIAIDLDDVLAAHVPAFVSFSNTRYGTNLTLEDYSDRWGKLWQVEHEEVLRRAKEFHVPESVASFQRIEEAEIALKSLSEAYKLVIVTARRANLTQTTIDWIDKHFPQIFDEVRIVPVWDEGSTVTKADVCQQIQASCLIDDMPNHCNLVAACGIKALLFGDYSWNRNAQISSGVERVRDWPAVVEYLGV